MFSLTLTSCAGHPQLEEDVGVVAPVAGEAVDLVQDHVVDVSLLFDAGQHALELTPVGGFGALAAVEIGVDDFRTERLGLAAAGLLLSRQ